MERLPKRALRARVVMRLLPGGPASATIGILVANGLAATSKPENIAMTNLSPRLPTTEITTREAINELKPGDRIEVLHQVKVGSISWKTKTVGEVVSFERRRHGLHFRRNPDDKSFSDLVVLKLADGSLTTVTMDEYSQPAAIA